MRSYLSRLTLIFLGLLLVNIPLYIHHEHQKKPYFSCLIEKPASKTFVFGDSHANCLRQYAKKFNLQHVAYGSDSYKDMRRKLEYLLSREVKIDTILLTVDSHTLSTYREEQNNDQYSSLIDNLLVRYLPIINAQYTTTLPIIFERKVLAKINLAKKDINSKVKTFEDLSHEERTNLIHSRWNTQFKGKQTSEELRGELETIMNICEKRNIFLIGVRYPLIAEYSIIVDSNDFGALQIFKDKGYPVLNYQNEKLPYSFFKDQDHLNEVGGLELIKMIIRDTQKSTNISAD